MSSVPETPGGPAAAPRPRAIFSFENVSVRFGAAPILDSVRRTGRMVYAQEAPGFVSLGSEIAATVMERAFYALEAPVIRVSGFDTPFPPAKLVGAFLPDADRILEAVDRSLAY